MIISDKLGARLSAAMVEAEVITSDKSEIYAYCYSYLFDKIIFTIYIVLTGIVMRHPLSGLILLCVLLPLRSLCGGVHADTQIVCSILSFALPPFAILLSLYAVPFHPLVSIPVFSVSLIILLLTAPVGNKNKPMNKDKYTKLKKALIIYSIPLTAIFSLLIYFDIKELYILTAICTLCCAVSVLLGIIKNRRQGVCTSI